jgi:hypothetical protein
LEANRCTVLCLIYAVSVMDAKCAPNACFCENVPFSHLMLFCLSLRISCLHNRLGISRIPFKANGLFEFGSLWMWGKVWLPPRRYFGFEILLHFHISCSFFSPCEYCVYITDWVYLRYYPKRMASLDFQNRVCEGRNGPPQFEISDLKFAWFPFLILFASPTHSTAYIKIPKNPLLSMQTNVLLGFASFVTFSSLKSPCLGNYKY